jgi:hypothetical protein
MQTALSTQKLARVLAQRVSKRTSVSVVAKSFVRPVHYRSFYTSTAKDTGEGDAAGQNPSLALQSLLPSTLFHTVTLDLHLLMQS